MPLKTLIVDDEYPARKELRYLLSKYPAIEVVGEATNAIEAAQLVSALDYSLLFLDIAMPGCNGMELTKKIQEKNTRLPYVVFVTAHEEYALDAFSVDAVDYLLKPVDPKRLEHTIRKVLQLMQEREVTTVKAKVNSEAPKTLSVIPVELSDKTILVDTNDIIYIYASDDYSNIKTLHENYKTRYTLKELELRLNPEQFIRCHRSYLVNIGKIREIIALGNGTLILKVQDQNEIEVPVSRMQAKRLRKILGM